MIGAHFSVDRIDLAERAGLCRLDHLQNCGIVAVHIAELNHQRLLLRQIQKALIILERTARGLIHMNVLACADAALRRFGQIPNIGFHEDRITFFKQLLLGIARQSRVVRMSAALPLPIFAGLGIADHLEKLGKFTNGIHLRRAVIMADSDLADFDSLHIQSSVFRKRAKAH